MKKIKVLVLVLFGFIALNSQAQFNVGVTVGPQLPMGDFGDTWNTGFGANVFAKYMLNDNMGLGLNVGYYSFGSDFEGFTASMMPITAFYHYYFGDSDFKPYIGADIGLYNYGYEMELDLGAFGTIKADDSKMYFGFAPTAGVLYGLNDKLSLVGNIKYHVVSTEESSSSFLGINVGINFAF